MSPLQASHLNHKLLEDWPDHDAGPRCDIRAVAADSSPYIGVLRVYALASRDFTKFPAGSREGHLRVMAIKGKDLSYGEQLLMILN